MADKDKASGSIQRSRSAAEQRMPTPFVQPRSTFNRVRSPAVTALTEINRAHNEHHLNGNAFAARAHADRVASLASIHPALRGDPHDEVRDVRVDFGRIVPAAIILDRQSTCAEIYRMDDATDIPQPAREPVHQAVPEAAANATPKRGIIDRLQQARNRIFGSSSAPARDVYGLTPQPPEPYTPSARARQVSITTTVAPTPPAKDTPPQAPTSAPATLATANVSPESLEYGSAIPATEGRRDVSSGSLLPYFGLSFNQRIGLSSAPPIDTTSPWSLRNSGAGVVMLPATVYASSTHSSITAVHSEAEYDPAEEDQKAVQACVPGHVNPEHKVPTQTQVEDLVDNGPFPKEMITDLFSLPESREAMANIVADILMPAARQDMVDIVRGELSKAQMEEVRSTFTESDFVRDAFGNIDRAGLDVSDIRADISDIRTALSERLKYIGHDQISKIAQSTFAKNLPSLAEGCVVQMQPDLDKIKSLDKIHADIRLLQTGLGALTKRVDDHILSVSNPTISQNVVARVDAFQKQMAQLSLAQVVNYKELHNFLTQVEYLNAKIDVLESEHTSVKDYHKQLSWIALMVPEDNLVPDEVMARNEEIKKDLLSRCKSEGMKEAITNALPGQGGFCAWMLDVIEMLMPQIVRVQEDYKVLRHYIDQANARQACEDQRVNDMQMEHMKDNIKVFQEVAEQTRPADGAAADELLASVRQLAEVSRASSLGPSLGVRAGIPVAARSSKKGKGKAASVVAPKH